MDSWNDHRGVATAKCVKQWCFFLQWWRRFCRSLASRASVTGQQLLRTCVCFTLSLSAARGLALFQSHLSVWKLWFHSDSFTPTKVPNVRYELSGSVSPAVASRNPAVTQVTLKQINSMLLMFLASSCLNVLCWKRWLVDLKGCCQQTDTRFSVQVSLHRDFSAVRDQAGKMIQTAFTLLDQEFQKIERWVFH